ncbi:MAG: hypothetical protein KJP08_06050 [Gammaproteobacteria bacterium]|nr:hypothetical protein [Gammaproteobacteria bacterium]NNF50521.1 hypothetical protein [Woeseiaceae bacterium]MBT8094352.1 hypothetical protein [Gammaproteobacteria bacterium]MBT8104425.1 hypothetical protein [Gammaproteobacteria bacterium]NNK24441.1 hypothetical protein [Woeseiaceae bacterium]
MSDADTIRRILLAVTETSPVETLWQSLLDAVENSRAEVVTVFVRDEHWRRAASLPFTREISRLSGLQAEFTHRRARQVSLATAVRVQQRLEHLASKTRLKLEFEVVSEQEGAELARRERHILLVR